MIEHRCIRLSVVKLLRGLWMIESGLNLNLKLIFLELYGKTSNKIANMKIVITIVNCLNF